MKRVPYLLGVILLLAAVSAQATLAVIVHPSNYDNLNEMQLRNLYLGKSKTFPSGGDVTVLDLAQGNAARDEFLQKVLRRNEANLNAYWARMLFSSQGRPPRMLQRSQDVLEAVAADRTAIGYVALSDVDTTRVRVVMVFD